MNATHYVMSVLLAGSLVGCGADQGPDPEARAVSHQRAPSRPSNDPKVLPYYGDESFTPQWSTEVEDKFHRVGEFALTNQFGETIGAQTFANKVYVTNFFFTTCAGVCAKMNTNLARVQAAFAEDDEVMLLSHSVTPDVDTPEVLEQYAERYGCAPGKWHLATGDRDEVYRLGREVYFVEEDQGRRRERDAFLHSENLILVDTEGHLRGIYNGLNRADVDRLIRDIGALRGAPTT